MGDQDDGHGLGDLPGDQIELVAFDVGEGRPAGLASLQVAEPPGAQAQQPLGLGVEGVTDEIEVHAVLDGLQRRRGQMAVRPPSAAKTAPVM
jgi:hypothetical protein